MPKKVLSNDFIHLRIGAATSISGLIIELMGTEFGDENMQMYRDYIYGHSYRKLAKERNINILSVKTIIKAIEDRMATISSKERLSFLPITAQVEMKFTMIGNEELLTLRKSAGLVCEDAVTIKAAIPDANTKTSIEQLKLSTRVKNIIYRQQINFVEDLLKYTCEDFMRVRGGGSGFRAEVERALRAEGLKLREEQPVI